MRKNYFLLIKKIINIICIAFFSIFYSQNISEARRKTIFDSLNSRVLTNAATIFNNGKQMLNYSKTDAEFSKSYHVMGDGKYKDGDYPTAIQLLEKADDYAQKANLQDYRIATNALLVYTYRYAGLPNESDAKIEVIKNIVDINNYNDHSKLLQTKATAFEIDKNYCAAIPYRLKELELYKNQVVFVNPKQKNDILIFANIHLAYINLKCKNLNEAYKAIGNAEKIYQQLGAESPTYYIENYYLVKALIALRENKIEESKVWFNKSYKSANLTENKSVIKKVLNEMRESGIFNSLEEKTEISDALYNLQNFQTDISKNVTTNLVNRKDLLLKNEKKNTLIIGSGLAAICLGLIIFIFRNKRIQKKRYAQFEKIISDIENQNKKIETPVENSLEKTTIDVIKNSETEEALLKSLEIFEKKNQFTTPRISLAQMSVMLKTNSKYLTYILKKYRNSDFSNYINDCRIDYIINEMNSNPQLLQYKIAALAEKCGYTSHSQFTSIFKSKKGISPSELIYFLKKKKEKTNLT